VLGWFGGDGCVGPSNSSWCLLTGCDACLAFSLT